MTKVARWAAADYSNGAATGPSGTIAGGWSRKQELAIMEFEHADAWDVWLDANHADSPGVWLKIAKKGAPRATVSYAAALDVALAYGWIDGQKGRYDDAFWLQRFTRRGPRSKWSQVNREKAEALIEHGRMKPPGLRGGRARQAGRPLGGGVPGPESGDGPGRPPARRSTRNPDAQGVLRDAHRRRPGTRSSTASTTSSARTSRAKRIANYIERLNERKTLFDD